MKIFVNEKEFTFKDDSEIKVEAGGCDLYIKEQSFDTSTEKVSFSSGEGTIQVPGSIECRLRRIGSCNPRTTIYEDAEGRKRLYTYFD